MSVIIPNPAEADTDTPVKDRYLVAYARVIDDKADGVYVHDVYFGGVADSCAEATRIAHECTAQAKGGIILPKVIPVKGDIILDALEMAHLRFRVLESQMINSEEVYDRNSGR
jgi:hypothetical protein